MKSLRIKRVMRLDTIQRHFRIFRLMWERGQVGDGDGYSAKLTFAVTPRLLGWQRDGRYSFLLILLGLRLHYARSYGGRFA